MRSPTVSIFESKEKIRLTVEGMTCEHCEMKVKTALSSTPGVAKVVSVDRTKNLVVVQVNDSATATGEILAKVVTETGYTAKAQ